MNSQKYIRFYTLVLGIAMLVSCSSEQTTQNKNQVIAEDLQRVMNQPLQYVCYTTPDSLTIDGKLDEPVWEKAQWTTDFVDIEGDYKPKPLYQTRAKMLYDANYLYIAAELYEPHIWAYLTNHDDIVFRDNDFEVFIDPDNDTWNYFEFEINAQKTVFDLVLPQPYRTISAALHSWDFKGVKKAVSIDGTLNNGSDTDQKWTIELAIPFSSMAFGLESGRPDTAKFWRINFSRVNWNTEWKDGKYQKLVDQTTGKPLAEYNWVWSPVGVVSMHMPERWGYLKFSAKPAGEGSQGFVLPESEKHKQILWPVFYRQEAFMAKNKKYASTMSDLGADLNSLLPSNYQFNLQANDLYFTCELIDAEGKVVMWINSNGKLQEKTF